MNSFFIIIFILLAHFTYCQDKYPTKAQLQRTLTQKTKLKERIYNPTNWFALESDSSFRIADTLSFYSNSDYRYGKLIYNFVEWNFYKKDAFGSQRIQLCKEPTTATAIKDRDMYTFQILDNQSSLVLQIFNKGLQFKQFKVLSLTEIPLNNQDNATTNVLKMRRIKSNQPLD